MAYVGVNKAQDVKEDYLIGANARNSIVGTVANTALNIGQQLHQTKMMDDLEDMNTTAELELTKAENDVYQNTPVEEREAKLTELYNQYYENNVTAYKTNDTVKKQFKKTLSARRVKTLSKWDTQHTQETISLSNAHNENSGNSLATSSNIVGFLKSNGLIAEKGQAPAKKEPSLADGFVTAKGSTFGSEADAPQDIALSPKLQEMYENGASEFELAVAGFEYYAQKRHPNNKEAQADFVRTRTDILRETLPNNDLNVLFDTTFSVKNADNWDFEKNFAAYEASLEGESYGGQPLSDTKKAELLRSYSDKYADFVTRNTRAAKDIVTSKVTEQINALKSEMLLDGSKKVTSGEISKIYDEAFKDSPHLRRYIAEQETAHKTLGLQSEVLSLEQEYKRGFLRNGSGTAEEQKRFDTIATLLSDDQRLALQQKALQEANLSHEIGKFIETGKSYSEILGKSDQLGNGLRSGNYQSLQEFYDAVEQNRAVLGDGFANSLISEGKGYFSDKESLKNDAVKQALTNANKDLAFSQLNETLSKTKIEEIGAKYGLTKEENPDFYLDWEQHAKNVSITNAQKVFTKENLNNTILPGQVDEIAKVYGLEEGDAVYKQMLDTAKANEAKVHEQALAAAKGFAKEGESTTGAVEDAGSLVKQYTDGTMSRADALSNLADMSNKLTESEYLNIYSSLATASTIKSVTNQAKFEESVYRPFVEESETIMPGQSRQRLTDAGLDPIDFASELAELEDREYINQHRQAVAEVSADMYYLALKEMNMSDELIESMGVPLPDTSFQRTLEWMHEHPNETPKTAAELARQNVESAKTKMLGSTLPSGKAAPSGSGYDDIKKQFTESAKKVHTELTNGMGNFAKHNNPQSISRLDMLKFVYEDSAYDGVLYDMVRSGEITMDEYSKRVAEDISIYKGPEYKKVQDALKVFEDYIRQDNNYTIDANDDRTYMDPMAIDKTIEGYKAAFFSEYQMALSNSNGGYVDPKLIAERVYTNLRDTSYANKAKDMMEMLKGDTTQMFGSSGLFSSGEKDIYGAYNKIFSNKSIFFGQQELENYLSDPNGNDDGISQTSRTAYYLGMASRGASETEIANAVALDAARYLGIDIPADAGESDIKSIMNKQSGGIRARWEQLSLISKWSVDIQRKGASQISEEFVSIVGEDANVTPFFTQSGMGVSVGETRFFYEPGNNKADPSFYYFDKNNQRHTLTSTSKAMEDAQKKFTNSFGKSIRMNPNRRDLFSKQNGLVIKNDDGTLQANVPAVVKTLQEHISGLQAGMENNSAQYLDALNRQALEWNTILGEEVKEYYTNVEYFVDLPKLQKAYESGSILSRPIEDFIGYRLVGKHGASRAK